MRLTLMKKENKNMTEHNIVIGSRGSRLAVIQSEDGPGFYQREETGMSGRNPDHENDR